MASFAKQATPLMSLLESRKSWDLPLRQRPSYHFIPIVEAARAYARANPSDPFAYGRMVMNFRQGLEDPSEVLANTRKVYT